MVSCSAAIGASMAIIMAAAGPLTDQTFDRPRRRGSPVLQKN
jgi:hypothetical protein